MKWNVRAVVSSTLGFLLLVGVLAAIALVVGTINTSCQPDYLGPLHCTGRAGA